MSLTVLGMAALGMVASRGHKTYLLGSDVLGADVVAEVAPVHVVAATPGGMTYWSSVAAGLTVVALWTAFTKLTEGRR